MCGCETLETFTGSRPRPTRTSNLLAIEERTSLTLSTSFREGNDAKRFMRTFAIIALDSLLGLVVAAGAVRHLSRGTNGKAIERGDGPPSGKKAQTGMPTAGH